MSQSARIDSPDTIKEFRNHWIAFDEVARQAVFGMRSDASRVLQSLRHQQLSYWKNEVKRADEKMRQARDAYTLARLGSEAMRKNSYQAELKALRKAEQRKAFCEAKIQTVKKWTSLLEQQTEKLMGPVNKLAYVLDAETPKALGKLDLLVRSLEEYLRSSAPSVGSVHTAGGTGNENVIERQRGASGGGDGQAGAALADDGGSVERQGEGGLREGLPRRDEGGGQDSPPGNA